MAISEHERKLLTAFWEKHRSLILAAFYAISSDPNQDPDVRDEADKVIRTLGSKDYSLYEVVFDGRVAAPDLKKTYVGGEVARLLIEGGLSDDEFVKLKSDTSSGFQLLKQEAEMTEGEKRYDRYRLSRGKPVHFQNMEYFASGNWGEKAIRKFQAFLAAHFPSVKLRKQKAGEAAAADS